MLYHDNDNSNTEAQTSLRAFVAIFVNQIMRGDLKLQALDDRFLETIWEVTRKERSQFEA